MAKQHERAAIVGAEPLHRVARPPGARVPAIAVTHAVGVVQQDDQLAGAPVAAAAETSAPRRNGRANAEHDQQQRREPQHQQPPVLNPPPPHRLIRNLAQEHQRRKLDDLLPLALHQMQQDRNGQRGETDEEQRGEEGHVSAEVYRTRLRRSRAPRGN